MNLRRPTLLLLLPLGLTLAACESSQPSYSAANANSAPPPAPAPAAPPAQPKPADTPPVAAAAPVAAPPRENAPPRIPAALGYDAAKQYAQVPAGKMGPMPKLGVGSCDDYVERYRACFNGTQIPREQKFPLRRELGGEIRQWKAAIAAGRISEVAAACAAADSKARVAFAKVGCTSF